MLRNLLFFLFAMVTWGSASTQIFQWAEMIEGPGTRLVKDIVTDDDGNVYLGGAFSNHIIFHGLTSADTLYSSGSTIAFLTKYSADGEVLWATKWEAGHGEVIALGVNADKEIYVGAGFGGTIDLDPGTNEYIFTHPTYPQMSHPYLMKLDPAGNLIWVHTYPGSAERITDLDLDPQGNVFVTGTFLEGMDADPDSSQSLILTTPWTQSQYVQKFAPDGDLVWAFSVQSLSFNTAKLSVDDQGYLYLYGGIYNEIWLNSTAGQGAYHSTSGDWDPYAAKYGLNGELIWGFGLPASGFAYTYDIVADGFGNTYCLGGFKGNIDVHPGPGVVTYSTGPQTSEATFLIKIDASGQLAWSGLLKGDDEVKGMKVMVGETGLVYVAGRARGTADLDPGPGIQSNGPQGTERIFLLILDQYGNYVDVWNTEEGGQNGYARLENGVFDGDGRMYLVGGMKDLTDLDPGPGLTTLGTAGSNQGFITRWDPLSENSPFVINTTGLIEPTCQDSGLVSWTSFYGIPPIEYFWNGQSIGSDTSVQIAGSGLHTLSGIDSLGQSFQIQYLLDGPTDLQGHDLRASVLTEEMRPGFPSTFIIDVSNEGCYPVSGEIFLVLDTSLNFDSAAPPPDRIIGDTLFWDIFNLTYDSGNVSISVTVIPDTFAVLGQEVCMDIGVTVVNGDLNVDNNLVHHCQLLVNSYDPNDIQVHPLGACEERYVESDQVMTYKIRFQNTGNASAINIRIADTLDPYLDISTLKVLSQSHPGLITEIGWNGAIEFNYEGIELPDSFSDPEGSQGFIIYEVAPVAYIPEGTVIGNRAAIYFDFNPPIITNTVQNTFVDEVPACPVVVPPPPDPTPDPETSPLDALVLYPNPSSGEVYLLTPEGTIIKDLNVTVYSSLGQLVYQNEFSQLSMEIIILNQPDGIYYLAARKGKSKKVFKILVRK